MRSFILLLAGFGLMWSSTLLASPSNPNSASLFTIVEPFDPVISDQGEVLSKPDLNSKMREGMADLLVRLSGDAALPKTPEGRRFIKEAKSWLSTYHFAERKEDGVSIGQNLVLDFDKQRLLEAFQSAQIQVWPKAERQSTLLMGSFVEAGTLMQMSLQNLQYRPDIDFRGYPNLLALPYQLPAADTAWVYPLSTVNASLSQHVQTLLLKTQQDYLLSFQLEFTPGAKAKLLWKLFDKQGQALGQAKIEGENMQALLKAMFARMIGAYSYAYRDSASVLNSAQVSFDGLLSAEQLFEIENYLQSQKPMVHQAVLLQIAEDQAWFEVIYQGNYQRFIETLMAVEGSVLVDESALLGEVNLRMQGLGETSETLLIDLAQEFAEQNPQTTAESVKALEEPNSAGSASSREPVTDDSVESSQPKPNTSTDLPALPKSKAVSSSQPPQSTDLQSLPGVAQ